MDLRHLDRLKEEQRKAISETESKISQMKKFQEDYRHLQSRLKTLPEKLSYDIMVPFGKHAFMPGRLVHTNEIMVLLGDNWFVERSATQAADIAERRIKDLDMKLKELEEQQKLLQPRLNFTSDLQAEIQGHGDITEIVEDYDEDKEKLWDEQHRENVKKYKHTLQRNPESQIPQPPEEAPSTTDSLWSRLKELEKQEAELGELDSPSDEEASNGSKERNSKHQLNNVPPVSSNISSPVNKAINSPVNTSGTSSINKPISTTSSKKVVWADEVQEQHSDKEASSSEEEVEDSDEDSDNKTNNARKPARKVITFKHSTHSAKVNSSVENGDNSIRSPADIYKMYSVKPILKNSSSNTAVSEHTCKNNQLQTEKETTSVSHFPTDTAGSHMLSHQAEKHQIISSAQRAFTGLVVDKSGDSISAQKSLPASVDPVEQPKRVSKFKASRAH